MGNTYNYAPDVRDAISEQIQKSYPILQETPFRIECVYTTNACKIRGVNRVFKTSKISGISAFLATSKNVDAPIEPESFFCVQVWRDGWSTLPAEQKAYIADMICAELSVIEQESGDISKSLNAPDVVVFAAVVARHDTTAMPDIALLMHNIQVSKSKNTSMKFEEEPEVDPSELGTDEERAKLAADIRSGDISFADAVEEHKEKRRKRSGATSSPLSATQ